MEVIATGPPSGRSNKLCVMTIGAEEMRAMKAADDSRKLSSDDKLVGYTGWPIDRLLAVIEESMGGAIESSSVGVFTAVDGAKTLPISIADLKKGVLLHTNDKGEALRSGGPIRLWFPSGEALQVGVCGKLQSPNLKGVVRFELSVPEGPACQKAVCVCTQISVAISKARDLVFGLPLPVKALCGVLLSLTGLGLLMPRRICNRK